MGLDLNEQEVQELGLELSQWLYYKRPSGDSINNVLIASQNLDSLAKGKINS